MKRLPIADVFFAATAVHTLPIQWYLIVESDSSFRGSTEDEEKEHSSTGQLRNWLTSTILSADGQETKEQK
jgi:hypothetical protein